MQLENINRMTRSENMVNNNQVDLRFQLKLTFHLYFLRDIYKNVETISLNQNLISIWIYHVFCFLSLLIVQVFSSGNNILNPGGYRDQIIPLFGSNFKFCAVSWYIPKNPVRQHGWETKKILQFRSSKTAFPAIFHKILFKNIASFFF